MPGAIHPSATQHLPPFITPPGETDVLMNVTIVLLVAIVLMAGNLYLRLHALPERIAHRSNLVQFEIVAVLALLALLTHNNILWVAALLLALIRIPDFSTPLTSIADSLGKVVAASGPERREAPAIPAPVLEREPSRTSEAESKAEPDPTWVPDPEVQSQPKRVVRGERRAGAPARKA
jgi:hypothetical protein